MVPVAHGEPDEFDLDISRGNEPGITGWGMLAHTEDSQTTERTVWTLNTNYVIPPSASIMTVSSTDVNDAYNDTGGWVLQVDGLDENYNQIIDNVVLNGQNPVNTSLEFLRINYLRLLQNGASQTNEGNLYVGTGAVVGGIPANIYGYVDADYSVSMTGIYTVPANTTLYLTRIWVTCYTTKSFDIYFKTWRTPENLNWTMSRNLETHTGQAFIERTLSPTVPVPERTTIEISAQSDQAGGKVNVEIRGVLVNESEANGLSWGDINWLSALVWLVLTALGYATRQKVVLVFSGLLGIVLGLYLLSSSGMVGIIVLLFSIYLLYEGTGDQ
jgi:hypothetical protein